MELIGSVLDAAGRGCMGLGGFLVDAEGRLIEGYEEDWPEETERGIESENGENAGAADCVWGAAERGGA